MNEPQLLEEQRKRFGSRIYRQQTAEEVPEVLEYEPSPITTGETPLIVGRLGIQAGWEVDPQIKTKVLAVDSFIRERVGDEDLRDSEVSYDTIINRMIGQADLEDIVRRNSGTALLDQMFQRAAIEEKMSGQSYLERFAEHIKWERVTSLLSQLKEALKAV